MASFVNTPPARNGKEDDIVIAVMGSTGTGKSSFIKLLTGNESIVIGDSLESETSDVKAIPLRDPVSGRNVIIADTPGFDDSREGVSDTDILKKITDFLLNEYDEKRKLTGLVYLQRISDPRVGGQSNRNLRMFRSLCGTVNFKNVVVLTTFWDRVPNQEGVRREEQMKAEFFKDLVDGGANFMRHDNTIESAIQVLSHVVTLAPTNVQIQEEIRVEGKTLEQTAAGAVHREEVERLIAKHQAEVDELKSEMDAIKEGNNTLRRELEEERNELQKKLERWEGEKLELHAGLAEERKYRERLETEAVEEKKRQEEWRGEQERNWASKLNDQGKAHEEAMQKMKAEFEKMKVKETEEDAARSQARVQSEAVRQAVERALEAERSKPYRKKGMELANEIPLVPNVFAKPVLGGLGMALDGARRLLR